LYEYRAHSAAAVLKTLASLLGRLVKRTYRYQDDAFPDWKYLYFFFYQRVLLFNFHVPWPVHPSSYVTSYRNISFGSRTSPGSAPGQYIQGENGIILGSNVRLAPGVKIISANHKVDNFQAHQEGPPLRIGDNVWVGANAVLLPGVSIGSNTVIGAGSVVTKDIPSGVVAFGNPCRVHRSIDDSGSSKVANEAG
jgi:acetyltransferase-like isoleucine patch superfamily enzyme